MRQLESRFLWLSNAGVKMHNGLYATSIRTTREGEIYPIPEQFYRGVRFKERGALRRVHKGGKHGHVQTVVVSSTSSRASNRRVGILPMRSDSRHGAAPQDESANVCMYNIHHIAPGNERPALAETKCGIVYHAFGINKTSCKINKLQRLTSLPTHPPCVLWYDSDPE